MTGNAESVVSIHPYFRVPEGKMEAFKALMPEFVAKTGTEEACLYYHFTIDGDVVFCREAYVGAEGALAHLENVGELLGRALEIAELLRLEIHGGAAELVKLKEPLKDFSVQWFEFATGV